MHVKNTLIKKKFREIYETLKEDGKRSFIEVKQILRKSNPEVIKKQRNIIAGLIVKKNNSS